MWMDTWIIAFYHCKNFSNQTFLQFSEQEASQKDAGMDIETGSGDCHDPFGNLEHQELLKDDSDTQVPIKALLKFHRMFKMGPQEEKPLMEELDPVKEFYRKLELDKLYQEVTEGNHQ